VTVATLEQLWADRNGRDITQVCKRDGKPGIYIAYGHKRAAVAARHAREKQNRITEADIEADDWYLAPAP
jgi:hypothetical protein